MNEVVLWVWEYLGGCVWSENTDNRRMVFFLAIQVIELQTIAESCMDQLPSVRAANEPVRG
jgi:hypothetical protein